MYAKSKTTMKFRHLITAIITLATTMSFNVSAQIDEHTAAKRAQRRNLVVKEWNTDARTKTRWMDRVTTYDEQGRKIEEIEYAQYGQKWRETYEYGENDKIVKEVLYDDRNKPTLIRKYEYNSENKKTKQYNYAPNGKLLTVKVFEYIVDGL